MRKQVRKMQREAQKKADKEALKQMYMPKGLRQFFKRHGYGAERILSTYAKFNWR
jgi:hypothetical protein